MSSSPPPAGRLLAFGDVHGCTLQLDALWAAVKPTPADTVIFLGDYVDRGPDSKGAIERLIAWQKTHNLICLRGNHELMMTRAKDHPEERKLWQYVGGADCLASYSAVPGRMGKFEEIPEEHFRWMNEELVDYHETDRVVFIHATLDPDVPFDEQTEDDLFWKPLEGPIRLKSGKTVVCGHTAQKTGTILDLGTTVCIDTNAYGIGMLTCLDVSSWHYWQANLIGRVSEGDLPKR